MFLGFLSNLGVILFMNSQWLSSVILATGQSIPFTGAWVNTNQSRDTQIITFASGIGVIGSVVSIQTQTLLSPYHGSFQPGASNEAVTLSSYAVTSGYQTYTSTVPSNNLRIVVTGAGGQVFGYAVLQN